MYVSMLRAHLSIFFNEYVSWLYAIGRNNNEANMSQANPLVIAPTVRQDDCEDYLDLIHDGYVSTLTLPSSLTTNGVFGLDAMLVHLVTTKARQPDGLSLVIPDDPLDAELYLDKLCLTSYGFAALALASKITGANGDKKSLTVATKRKEKRLKEIANFPTRLFLSEEGLSLPSVYGQSSERASWMYSSSSQSNRLEVQTPTEIQGWLYSAAERILPKEFFGLLDGTRREALCTIAFELIENAAQHGRYDERGASLNQGIRGLNLRLVDVGLGGASEIAGGNSAVNMYFNRRVQRDKKQDSRYLELTVFDSGIGFHNWLNAPCNDNERTRPFRGKSVKDTVRSCVFMHATSKGNDGTGIGLYRATRLLKELSGFVRIRTGTECYFARLDQTATGADRKLGGDRDDALDPHVELQEWYPHRALRDANGSSVTFGIPLMNWGKR
jgi:hypothetical protein